MNDLFEDPSRPPDPPPTTGRPLAERMRPRRLEEFVGQDAVLGAKSTLRASLAAGHLPSLVLWGPPGCGKTTLAACLAREIGATFLPFSAVRVGVKEIKATLAEAAKLRRTGAAAPLLFLDEIHRFNKAQQDALLPAVEAGDVVLVGATTENPSFEVNAALLSRCRVIVLEGLGPEDITSILARAVEDPRGLGEQEVEVDESVLRWVAERCGGDARFALNTLELAAQAARAPNPSRSPGSSRIDLPLVEKVLAEVHLLYDKTGEEHFNLISALHKSLRNSDVQAGLYWLTRMLEAGEDPLYVARRLVRFASEDVGMADPRALDQCVAATRAVHQLGMPEGALALAQAAVYLAQAPKSNALYRAYQEAVACIREGHTDPVPHHLRNAPTDLMKDLGYGAGYRYAHDEPEGVAEMTCLPDRIRDRIFYRPTDAGFEAEAADRLREAWKRARNPSPPSPRNSQEERP